MYIETWAERQDKIKRCNKQRVEQLLKFRVQMKESLMEEDDPQAKT